MSVQDLKKINVYSEILKYELNYDSTVLLETLEEIMTNRPIKAKQVNRSSSVIGWQNRGQAGTTVVQCSCIHSSTGPERTENGQYKCTAV